MQIKKKELWENFRVTHAYTLKLTSLYQLSLTNEVYLFLFCEFPLTKYQINDKRACIILALGSIKQIKKSIPMHESLIEHINIHNFHLISEMFTIYFPLYILKMGVALKSGKRVEEGI